MSEAIPSGSYDFPRKGIPRQPFKDRAKTAEAVRSALAYIGECTGTPSKRDGRDGYLLNASFKRLVEEMFRPYVPSETDLGNLYQSVKKQLTSANAFRVPLMVMVVPGHGTSLSEIWVSKFGDDEPDLIERTKRGTKRSQIAEPSAPDAVEAEPANSGVLAVPTQRVSGPPDVPSEAAPPPTPDAVDALRKGDSVLWALLVMKRIFDQLDNPRERWEALNMLLIRYGVTEIRDDYGQVRLSSHGATRQT